MVVGVHASLVCENQGVRCPWDVVHELCSHNGCDNQRRNMNRKLVDKENERKTKSHISVQEEGMRKSDTTDVMSSEESVTR